MDNYEAVCYKNSFLDQVIVRTDFMEFIPNETIHCKETEAEIRNYFPLIGKSQIVNRNAINFTIDIKNPQNTNTQNDIRSGIQKEFYTLNKKNKIIISNMFLVFEIHEYKSFKEFNDCLKSIVQTVFTNCKPTIVRTGLRYINLFKSERIKVRKKFFPTEIAACLKTKFEDEANMDMIRSMHLREYRIGNLSLNFRYGMYNPNYPGPMKDNNFTLDYDCFSNDALANSDDVLEVILHSHNAIQKLFESSITEDLRKEMRSE